MSESAASPLMIDQFVWWPAVVVFDGVGPAPARVKANTPSIKVIIFMNEILMIVGAESKQHELSRHDIQHQPVIQRVEDETDIIR
jgi:hypothetical protein